MTVVEAEFGGSRDLPALIERMGLAAREAAQQLATASAEAKNTALHAAAAAIRADAENILAANARDVATAEAAGLAAPQIDRARLDPARLEAIARGLEDIAGLEDPVGSIIAEWTRPNGLNIQRVRTPLGVIGVIYESRPNVTCDAGGLCLKAGNAVILRGGSESLNSTRIIVECMKEGLREAGLPEDAIQMIDTSDRSAVQHLLQCTAYVDLVIPRGGKGLVSLVRDQARVPTLLHLDGNCHTYVHPAADPDTADALLQTAPLRRSGF